MNGEASEAIRVLLVDDHAVVRVGLRAALERSPGIRVAGEAASAEAALPAVKAGGFDVLVLDAAMPGIGGLGLLRRMAAFRKRLKVVILSMHSEVDVVRAFVKTGVDGYVLKDAPAEELLRAVRVVARGEPYFCRRIARLIVEDLKGGAEVSPPRFARLTARESEVLVCVAEGCSNRQAAQKCGISVRTVEAHRARIMGKLDLHGAASLTRYAIREGLLAGR